MELRPEAKGWCSNDETCGQKQLQRLFHQKGETCSYLPEKLPGDVELRPEANGWRSNDETCGQLFPGKQLQQLFHQKGETCSYLPEKLRFNGLTIRGRLPTTVFCPRTTFRPQDAQLAASL